MLGSPDLQTTEQSHSTVPQHIAVIMDGNRRWAASRNLPAAAGHAWGARKVRSIVQACADRGVRYLTLFAFSTENWARPAEEVSSLMALLSLYLEKEVRDMNANGVRLRIVGDTSRFSSSAQSLISESQVKTAQNTTITLTIAANYGGRWDVLEAVKAWLAANPGCTPDHMNEASLRPHLAMAYAPDPDLLIRTGGELRISNFMLWQTAYTELFFTDVLWPSFDVSELDRALTWYGQRKRRFGASGVPQLALA